MIASVCQYCLSQFGIFWILVALGLLYLVVKWTTSKPRIPVFGEEFLLPPKPIERDSKIRNAVLKDSFKPNKVSSTTYDVIVIGSGPGGLSTAVLLSRLGYRVLVLEQHDVAGGTCHTFMDKGFEFETGVHYMGNLGPGEMWRNMMDQMTRGQVEFHVLDDAFDHIVVASDDGESSRTYKILSGEERYAAKLLEYFPGEREAIGKFLKVMKDLEKAPDLFICLKLIPVLVVKFLEKLGLFSMFTAVCKGNYHKMTLQEFVTSLTDNVDLQRCWTYICGNFGAMPTEMSVATYSFLNRHYVGGAYFPIGGSLEIPYHMINEIRERGGQVLVNANVKSIISNSKGEAVGVRMEKSDIEIRAKIIVSDAGFANTFHKLLPKHIAMKSDLYSLVDTIGPSNSCLSLFIGLDGTPEELGMTNANIWIFREGFTASNSYDLMYNTKYEDLPEDFIPPLVAFSQAAAKNPDSKNTMPGKSTLIFIILCSHEWFSDWHDDKKGRRGEDYENRKAEIADRIWKRCLVMFPHLADKAVYFEVGTSATNKHFLGRPDGEIYGLNHKLDRYDLVTASRIRPQTGIPGLYVTGSDLHCAGLIPALFSGIMTASSISNRILMLEFDALHKRLKKTCKLRKNLP